MLTLQLAGCWARAGKRVCVVDHDPQGSTLVFGKIAQRAGVELPFVPTNARVSGFDIYLHDHAPGIAEAYPAEILIMPVVLDAPSGAVHLRGRALFAERGKTIVEVVNRFRTDRVEPGRVRQASYSDCAVVSERALYPNLYGRGLTVFDAVGIPYLSRAQAEIDRVRQGVEAVMEGSP